jgi:hypothetical protein
MAEKKFRDINPFNLRLQSELRAKLEKSGEGKAKWSLNSEITRRLEESFEERRGLGEFSDGELIDELIQRWGRDAVYIRLGSGKE